MIFTSFVDLQNIYHCNTFCHVQEYLLHIHVCYCTLNNVNTIKAVIVFSAYSCFSMMFRLCGTRGYTMNKGDEDDHLVFGLDWPLPLGGPIFNISNKVLFRIHILILKKMTQLKKFTLAATNSRLWNQCDVSFLPQVFFNINFLCDMCNSIMDSMSQIVNILTCVLYTLFLTNC